MRDVRLSKGCPRERIPTVTLRGEVYQIAG